MGGTVWFPLAYQNLHTNVLHKCIWVVTSKCTHDLSGSHTSGCLFFLDCSQNENHSRGEEVRMGVPQIGGEPKIGFDVPQTRDQFLTRNILGVDSPFFSTIALFKNRLFPLGF